MMSQKISSSAKPKTGKKSQQQQQQQQKEKKATETDIEGCYAR